MEDMRLKFYTPVVTGNPSVAPLVSTQPACAQREEGVSFQEVLQRQLEKSEVTFSKHAVKRAAENNIELSPESLERLRQGVKMAEERNLADTLILVDKTAFLVNVKNNTVITTVPSSAMHGNVFTNIDGAVII